MLNPICIWALWWSNCAEKVALFPELCVFYRTFHQYPCTGGEIGSTTGKVVQSHWQRQRRCFRPCQEGQSFSKSQLWWSLKVSTHYCRVGIFPYRSTTPLYHSGSYIIVHRNTLYSRYKMCKHLTVLRAFILS